MQTYEPSFDELRADVEAELAAFLSERRAAVPEAAPLIDELSRLNAAGGKRLRPLFCYWGYRATGASHRTEIVRAAAALELLHLFAIVHDDIMDDAARRRGVPTIHALHGPGLALLAGDLALVLADDLFMRTGLAPQVQGHAFRAYSRMRQEVIAGQLLDLAASKEPATTEATARRIAAMKSGRYSVAEPLVIGCRLGQGPASLERALERFGGPLGEAFQYRDDLIGAFGDAGAAGKPVGSDARQGKRHVLYAKTVASMSDADRRRFAARWGSPDLTDDEIQELAQLMKASGAQAEVEELLGTLVRQAGAALHEATLDAASRCALRDLARRAVDREA